MKIAVFYELQYGGARRTVDEYIKHLSKTNEIDLYYVDRKEELSKKTHLKTYFYRFDSLLYSGGDILSKIKKDTIELYNLYKLHKKISDDINKRRYDIVFIHPSQYTQAPFLLRFIKCLKIYYCQEPLRLAYDPEVSSLKNIPNVKKPYEYTIRKIRKTIDKKNISYTDHILANSNYSKKAIKKAYDRLADVCYLGVDEEKFYNQNIKKEYDVLFIGENNERSGYNFLLKILELNKKIKVRFLLRNKEKITEEKLVEEYNKSKVVLALSKNEPFGLIPLEAMSCQLPVVALNEGGFKESILNNVTGYLLERNAEEFNKKINYLLKNEKVSKLMGKKGREWILDKWTWEKSSKKLEKLLLSFNQKK